MEEKFACIRIVEDDDAIRKLLGILISSEGYPTRLYESAERFMTEDSLSDPGCVLIDLELPGISGIELVTWISLQTEPLPTIVVTGNGNVQAAVRCLKSGATEFVEKPFDRLDLLSKIQSTVEIDKSQRAARLRLADLRGKYGSLSTREQEVIRYLAEGLSSKQVAGKLGLAAKTVEHCRARIMEKMQAESFAEIVRAIVELGL
jgi:two-component system response regulator FixJ